MLKIDNIEASYGKLKILKGLKINISKNDLVSIIGPNGSGKSTTLKCIFGLLKTEKGKIFFDKKEITNKNPSNIVKLGISYVHQGGRVFKNLTVDENLDMGAFTIKDLSIINKRKEEVYKEFPELEKKKNQKATFLSGGQQQMLAIGRALMLKPKLLLLDEPSAGLAPNLMVNLFRKIKQINKSGITVVLVEQNASMALQISNKAFVLESGKVAVKGNSIDLENSTLVKSLYLGH